MAKPASDLGQAVRQIYEKRPYPDPARARKRITWQLAPMEWIEATSLASDPPKRILVAGCGTGSEAFALRKRFPKAEILGVDFSARAIAHARRLQQTSRARHKIEFRRADLTSRTLRRELGGNFDFITCHGVLSYVPHLENALRNLADCLAEDGALYLGVNGSTHFSENWRPVLRQFGFDPRVFPGTHALRELLELCDALSDHPAGFIARRPADYLAGDLFGPLLVNLSLENWIAVAARAGLFFYGSSAAHRTLRRAFEDDLFRKLFPRPRAEAQRIAEQLQPAPFHRAVFRKTPAPEIPWKKGAQLLRWRPRLTGIYRFVRPKNRIPARGRHRMTFLSESTNTRVDLQVPRWVFTLLRAADGESSLREICTRHKMRIPARSLAHELYPLELLAVINLHPPL